MEENGIIWKDYICRINYTNDFWGALFLGSQKMTEAGFVDDYMNNAVFAIVSDC